MARLAIFLVALFVVASCGSATTLEDICKHTVDASYCVYMLKPHVSPSTDFKSTAWHKAVVQSAMDRADIAHNFMVRAEKRVSKSDLANVKTCQSHLASSLKAIGKGDLDSAAAEQASCYHLLKDVGSEGDMHRVRQHAEAAAKACRIANEIVHKKA